LKEDQEALEEEKALNDSMKSGSLNMDI